MVSDETPTDSDGSSDDELVDDLGIAGKIGTYTPPGGDPEPCRIRGSRRVTTNRCRMLIRVEDNDRIIDTDGTRVQVKGVL
ncbi:hypothetical protein C5B90_19290 [Haloferax sp. Atlit-12N]|uniref:hypothetical protein n=1 Tax=Haloferax sp. Atlit-12N TaxID=2077203 RepID=UPI000E26A8D4|nr:hypothetical protein [Haloferax sp. Atlit-12N]RDZ61417.1 hypothetical protein C5B90_19290 [Haloferax sp. Atlit-12N]